MPGEAVGEVAKGRRPTRRRPQPPKPETLQELARRVLAMEVYTHRLGEVGELFIGLGERVTAREAILLGQAAKAMQKGDTSSATFLRDSAGEKAGKQPQTNPFTALTPEELRAFIRSHCPRQEPGCP